MWELIWIGNMAGRFGRPRGGNGQSTAFPPSNLHESGFRERGVGTFSHRAATVAVGQDCDQHLTPTVGSQLTYKMRPYQSRTFLGRFHLGQKEEIDELILHQPSGMFVARRVAAERR
jgi:hypothetical protein